ncbi:hypothetical protein HDU86_007741 [Geranomyces michiganensis]|nr:hypothetical protein HDU86_007741 [Geranomyces michiganensis]
MSGYAGFAGDSTGSGSGYAPTDPDALISAASTLQIIWIVGCVVFSVAGSAGAFFFLIWRRRQHERITQQKLAAAGIQPGNQPGHQSWALHTTPDGQNLWYPLNAPMQPAMIYQQAMPYPPPGVAIGPPPMPNPPAGGPAALAPNALKPQQGMYGLPDHRQGEGSAQHEELKLDNSAMPWNASTQNASRSTPQENLKIDPSMPWNDVVMPEREQQGTARLRQSPVRSDFPPS